MPSPPHLNLVRHEPASHWISGFISALETGCSFQEIRYFLSTKAFFDLAIAFGVAFLARVGPCPVCHLFGIHVFLSFFSLDLPMSIASTHGRPIRSIWNSSTHESEVSPKLPVELTLASFHYGVLSRTSPSGTRQIARSFNRYSRKKHVRRAAAVQHVRVPRIPGSFESGPQGTFLSQIPPAVLGPRLLTL